MFDWLRRAVRRPTEQQQRLRQALSDYPPYAPPDWNPEAKSLRDYNAEYRDYFIGVIPHRLEALRAFLAKFDVAAELDDAGLMAVSAWLPQYGDLLVDDSHTRPVEQAYSGLSLPWTGALSGFNPMFDLGIYVAECLWLRRTKLKWIIMRDPVQRMSAHLISGGPGGKLFDPMGCVHNACNNIRVRKKWRQKRWHRDDNPQSLQSDAFYRTVISYAPPGRRRRKT